LKFFSLAGVTLALMGVKLGVEEWPNFTALMQ